MKASNAVAAQVPGLGVLVEHRAWNGLDQLAHETQLPGYFLGALLHALLHDQIGLLQRSAAVFQQLLVPPPFAHVLHGLDGAGQVPCASRRGAAVRWSQQSAPALPGSSTSASSAPTISVEWRNSA